MQRRKAILELAAVDAHLLERSIFFLFLLTSLRKWGTIEGEDGNARYAENTGLLLGTSALFVADGWAVDAQTRVYIAAQRTILLIDALMQMK